MAFGGNLPGWAKSGAGAVHIVDTANVHPDDSNPRDIAVMFWQDNVITQADPIAGSNEAGTEYRVEFAASPAVYQAPSQATTAGDGILVEVLRADDSALASHTHAPGDWAGGVVLITDGFTYTGDGSGDIRLRFGPSALGSGRFGGALDNISVSVVSAGGPQIASFTADPALLAKAGDPLTFGWMVELPLDSLTLDPGGLDLLPDTDGSGTGGLVLDPGPGAETTYTLTAVRDGAEVSREVRIGVQPGAGEALFAADFNDFTGGNFNGGQFESELDLAFGGNLPEWSKSGGGVVHAMDHANQAGNVVNPRDFAVMIWQDNVITLHDPIPSSNSAGVDYLVEFEASPAVYQAGSQQTSVTDGLLIEL
ncbi:MAG: hypothetical protein GWO24_15340, partial [Akkermansiaceae bacterium]|nr:hypothetical protein [Akkermansiaceae bacterium]